MKKVLVVEDSKLISGAGHFNKGAGYTKFEKLLEDIKSIL